MIQCNQISNDQLTCLISEPETEHDASDLVLHIEDCEVCQSRLTQLADTTTIESEATRMLSGFVTAEGRPPHASASPEVSHEESLLPFDYDLLSPPTHPEMMGRIGRYEVERLVGTGGMGVVFKAFDTELNRPVAVKVLASHLARNGAARQRFSRESRAAATVAHENIVAIHNVESNCKHPYLVMQFVQGESLQARIDREGPLSPERILQIGVQVANGLAAAHQHGIIHRDIKPANILLEDGVDRLLITDFGLARMVDDASMTHTGIVAGTPNYMSPEQARGDEIDFRTDLFSLGSVLYFLATGHAPFRAENAMGVLHRICHTPHRPVWQTNPAIPDSICAILDRLLEKSSSKRFPNANSVVDAMSRQLQSHSWRRPKLAARVKAWTRRHPIILTGLALLPLLGAAVLIWSGTQAGPQRTEPSRPTTASSNATPLPSEHHHAFDDTEEPFELWTDREAFDRELDALSATLQQQAQTWDINIDQSAPSFDHELRALEDSLNQLSPMLSPSPGE